VGVSFNHVSGSLAMTLKVHVGTSGWSYDHWGGIFYPEGLRPSERLSFYSEHFLTVEVNSSFYHLPSVRTVEKWGRAVPSGFIFSAKASRFVTHIKKLRDFEGPVRNFTDRVRSLGDKLGPILFQFPPGWHVNRVRLESLLEFLPDDLRYAFEFRDRSWLSDEIYSILRQHNGAFCIFDMPDFTSTLEVTSDIAYVRMHGGRSLYASRYSVDELRSWAGRLVEMSSHGVREIYVYFNNDAYGYAVENARELLEILGPA